MFSKPRNKNKITNKKSKDLYILYIPYELWECVTS